LISLRSIRNRWESGLRHLKEGSDVLRYRVALSAISLGLGAWLAVVSDKPWEFDLTQAASWNLGKIVSFYHSGRAHSIWDSWVS
jgi:hypothetical protein